MSQDYGLQDAHFRIGTKQTIRTIELGLAEEVFIAQDADPCITSKIVSLCEQSSVKIAYVDTMKNLGRTCGIDVGAATVAIVRQL